MGGVNGGPGLGVPEHVGMASTTGSGSVTIQRKHVVNEIRSTLLPFKRGRGVELTVNPVYRKCISIEQRIC